MGLGYTLAFTPFGNALIKPIIEDKLNESSPLPLTLHTLILKPNSLNILIQIDDKNSFSIVGTYSLFTQSFELNYALQLKELSRFNTLAKRDLSGALLSDGTVKGDLNIFQIKGNSDFAHSDTNYAIIIKKFTLEKTAIKLKDLDLKVLLAILGEKPYAKGKADLHLQLNDIRPKKL